MIRLPLLLLLAFLCALAMPGPLDAEESFTTPDKISNAALHYWQAFAMLPDLSDEELEQMTQVLQGKAEAATAKTTLFNSEPSLKIAAYVHPEFPCRWEIVVDGPATLLPHLAKARRLAQLMVLQARFDAAAGQQVKAVENLTRAMLVARNVDEGVLVQMLVGTAIENMTLDTAEALLPTLDQPAAERLQAEFAKLPPRTTFADSILHERRVFGEWMRPLMTGELPAALQLVKDLGIASDLPAATALVIGTKEDRTRRLEEFLGEYDKLAAASKLPPEEATARFAELEQGVEKSKNPLTRILMPAVSRANEQQVKGAERHAKFVAMVQQRVASSQQQK